MYIIQYGRNIVITDNMQLMSLSSVVVVQAFISSRLDYCNAILHGLPDRLMRRLQSVQSAAARLITGVPWRYHITLILWQLHWLPVRRTCWLQDCRPGFPVLDWSGIWLPGGRLLARRRRQRVPTSISKHSNLCHLPHVQHLWRPMLCSCRSTAMELAANQSKTVSQSGTTAAP